MRVNLSVAIVSMTSNRTKINQNGTEVVSYISITTCVYTPLPHKLLQLRLESAVCAIQYSSLCYCYKILWKSRVFPDFFW
jgi:hypothetical protein